MDNAGACAASLAQIAVALAGLTETQRLAALSAFVHDELRKLTRQQALAWLDSLFASLEQP